jgi:aminoglycoside phosphotransferase family enzyme/predicted kinase
MLRGGEAMQSTEMIQALCRPEAYPDHPTTVSMRQTHISWLFFTEDFVYKVKKAVNFGFLDFTSLEARRFFCEEEARLNRRLAPGVYLGVLAITEADGRIRLNGSGKVVDYALQMRRLPEDRMLPTLLDAGVVTPQIMRRLAQLLATFHAGADTGPEIDSGGTVDTIRGNWEENFTQTRPYLDWPLGREAYEVIRCRVLDFCHTRGALFAQRIASGRIRDGHGDLRAEHICLIDPPVIFDCIEFNRRFRHGDVAADVAFLAMDLDERGFAELSRVFVRAYVESSGDPGVLDVLDFYRCYRAFVRAKVECFRLDDPAVSAGDKRRAARATARYCRLAARYAEALRRPWLLLCCGLMGSGKSALAEALAPRLSLEVLGSDVTRKELAGVRPTTAARTAYGEGLYTPEWTDATYAYLFAQAEQMLAEGRSVLLDASFQRASHRRQALQLAASVGAECCVLECWCPEEELSRRLQRRAAQGGSVSDGRVELLAQQRASFEPLFDVPPSQHLRVDTSPPLTEVVENVVGALARPTGGCGGHPPFSLTPSLYPLPEGDG